MAPTVPLGQIAARRQVLALWWLAYLERQDCAQADRDVVELVGRWSLSSGSQRPSSRCWGELAPAFESSLTDTDGRGPQGSSLPRIDISSADRHALALVLGGHDVPAVAELEGVPAREVYRRLRRALTDLRRNPIIALRLAGSERGGSDICVPADPTMS